MRESYHNSCTIKRPSDIIFLTENEKPEHSFEKSGWKGGDIVTMTHTYPEGEGFSQTETQSHFTDIKKNLIA